MKPIGLVVAISTVCLAQQHAGAARPAPAARSYTNTTTPPGFTGSTGPVFAGSGRVPAAGARPYNYGARPPHVRAAGGVIYVPYAAGGYQYYGPEDYPAPVMYPNQQGQAPTVIINQNFIPQTASPVIREYMPDESGGIHIYQPGAPAAAQEEPQQQSGAQENPNFLIAFKDHTIYAAVAYWVEGDTLHYVTSGNRHNQVSLDLVDRELSARLNGERNVDFRLPPPGAVR